MKQKFTSNDIAAVVFELQSLVGLRLQNCYDPTPKLFLLKFAKPDVKEMVLVESGFRIHLTQFSRDKGGMPSGFCMRLRKHLRTKRLNAIRQLGVDRIVDMEFGAGEACYHLISEFYASGNIILTDYQYTIIALLRTVSPDETVKFAPGEQYPFSLARPFAPLTREKLDDILEKASGKDQLKKALGFKLDYSLPMVEHLLVLAGISPTAKVSTLKQSNGDLDKVKVDEIFEALRVGDHLLTDLSTKQQKGYIISKKLEAADKSEFSAYDEFHPFRYCQYHESLVKEFPSFNLAVDDFFTLMEAQKIELKAKAHEHSVIKKLENVRKEHTSRVEGLQQAQLSNEKKAQLIEQNLEAVDQALVIIRSALASGMDWTNLGQLIDEEKLKRNPIASMIDSLKLETNQITLLLKEPDYIADYGFDDDSGEDEDELAACKPEKVEVDISLSAFSNARRFYETKKVTAKKHEKTLQASAKALKSAEEKIQREMNATKLAAPITRTRKPFWFEKFVWFISTENYLVIAGRDAQQNELLVKRHFRKGDVYIHADIPGSSSVIVKNSLTANDPIPAATLNEAGNMAIIYSRAWDAKVVTSAYWVNFDQVSKTAPSGEYLGTGSFMIRGKKNFLPPVQLVYGFGLLFKVADECIAKHFLERRPALRGANDDDAAASDPTSPIVANDDVSTKSSRTPSVAQIAAAQLETASMLERDDKYNLESLGEQERVPEHLEDILNPTITDPRKYVTAKERRLAKKPKAPAEASNNKEPSETLKPMKKDDAKASGNSEKPLPRGKRTKLKRAKDKYKDQDEEDKAIMIELLAASGKQKPSGDGESKAPSKDIQDIEIPQSIVSAMKTASISAPQQSKNASDEDEGEENKEEIDRLLQEENVQQLDQEEVENLTSVDSLTGCPLADDILLFAIPVCAPYNTLQSYKYKIKLIPGSLKKGKAAREALHICLNHSAITPIEKELIKTTPEQEFIQTILGKVKLMAPGLTQSSAGGKGKAKSKKKH